MTSDGALNPNSVLLAENVVDKGDRVDREVVLQLLCKKTGGSHSPCMIDPLVRLFTINVTFKK
jgi:hypothetical protein